MLRYIFHFLSIQREVEEFDVIHKSIEKEINFRGTNLWILIFAILVASVGLNMNSTAVVIGAMLISPLMGPINGMGYSVATYDFPLLRRSIKNFAFAVTAGLLASTLYFLISPVSTAYSELLSRTSPTIYDVLIALFGGLAGILAISSKHKGNVIPGVAIATALMPPLCTAGYGLATAQFNYFFGALYLFTINSVFIAISSVVFSQLLKFPIRAVLDNAQKKKINRWITLVIVITVVPSIYFGYGLVQKEKFTENAGKFTRSVGVFEGNFLLKNEVNPGDKSITLIYGGNSLSAAHKDAILSRAGDFSLGDAQIVIEQGITVDEEDEDGTSNVIEQLQSDLNRLSASIAEKEVSADSLAQIRLNIGKELLSEIKPLYPKINSCLYSEAPLFVDSLKSPKNIQVVVLSHSYKFLEDSEKEKINSWLKKRLKSKNVKTFYEP